MSAIAIPSTIKKQSGTIADFCNAYQALQGVRPIFAEDKDGWLHFLIDGKRHAFRVKEVIEVIQAAKEGGRS